MSTGLLVVALVAMAMGAEAAAPKLVFCCSKDNDLYRVLTAMKRRFPRYATPAEAVNTAPEGAGVLILADGYPQATTEVPAAAIAQAAAKHLRLFVEYPSSLPGLDFGTPQATRWERGVVSSDAFGPKLPRLRLLGLHGCLFLSVNAENPLIVVAKVAGFDSAVFGIPQDAKPILFEHDGMLVTTTKLSQFVAGRYGPSEAWTPIWRFILGWLGEPIDIKWTPAVRPTSGPSAKLSKDAEKRAVRRGAEWYFNARMLVHPSWAKVYDVDAAKWPDRIGPGPRSEWPVGDGSLGVLEGNDTHIGNDGSQPVRWWRRHDCNGETAGTLAVAGKLLGDKRCEQTAANLVDYLYTKSVMANGDRMDPKRSCYGLFGWNDVKLYWGDMDGYGVYYGDDNARGMMGVMAAAAVLGTDRWDERLMMGLLANLRTTGKLGFRQPRIDEKPLEMNGWKHYAAEDFVDRDPINAHYDAFLMACNLWAYARTRDRIFLDRTEKALRVLVEGGSAHDSWRPARMMLPLAWLVRADDTAEHRQWLMQTAKQLIAFQEPCGAIRHEQPGPTVQSNEAYGTFETAITQKNGDPACDALYCMNFALIGLREAAAATGEVLYKDAEDKLAQFLCRIQVRSETRPELEGAWFRGFDYGRWDYWGSDADAGWGVWCTETGWTQSWIVTTLALRQMHMSLWDLTAESKIGAQLAKCRRALHIDEMP